MDNDGFCSRDFHLEVLIHLGTEMEKSNSYLIEILIQRALSIGPVYNTN